MLRYWTMGAASIAFLGVASIAATAAPATSGSHLRAMAQQNSVVDQVAYRQCCWRKGVKRCGWVDEPGVERYGYYYGRPRPEAFPTGSTAWWRAMDSEGRGGHGRSR
jgi:hypothetical protein